MKANPSPMSVADYCHAYNNKSIVVNQDYQRKDGLWSAQAKSFFIESILLEYPIPKIYLYARLNLQTRQTVKEVVDGQQRSQALAAFYNNKLRLSKNIDTEELKGLKYNQLDDDWKARFLGYSLPIDQFQGVPDAEVREAFRRMNANNVPLNDEEQRNARYQGPFKWFIISLAEKYKDRYFASGLFSRRDLIRMVDLKFYADLVLAVDQGLMTVKGKQLDDIYKRYNTTFAEEETFRAVVEGALDGLFEQPDMFHPVFMRSHVFGSIALAEIARRGDFPHLDQVRADYRELDETLRASPVPLDVLEAALQEPEMNPGLTDFINACTTRTNVESQKAIRFLHFYYASEADEGAD